MVRTGAATPQLITLIIEYFNMLDNDNSGTLSVEEITQRIQETQGHPTESTLRVLDAQTENMVSDMMGTSDVESVARSSERDEESGGHVHRGGTRRRRSAAPLKTSSIALLEEEERGIVPSKEIEMSTPQKTSHFTRPHQYDRTNPEDSDSDDAHSTRVRTVRRTPNRPATASAAGTLSVNHHRPRASRDMFLTNALFL